MQLDPTDEKALLSRTPPDDLADRRAAVQLHVPNVLRVPSDPETPDPMRWFSGAVEDGLGEAVPVTRDNEVAYLIDGPQTFRAMVDAIRTAKRAGHFIYLAAWYLDVDFELVHRFPDTTIRSLFTRASAQGVQIRALLWKKPLLAHNGPAFEFLTKELANGSAIHDGRYLRSGPRVLHERIVHTPEGPVQDGELREPSGAHHQKILVVYGENETGQDELVGFCGGVDINPDRVEDPLTGGVKVIRAVQEHVPVLPNVLGLAEKPTGYPMHDVHCRIRGAGAYRLLRTFSDRWSDHVDEAVIHHAGLLFSTSELRDLADRGRGAASFSVHHEKWLPEVVEMYRRRFALRSAQPISPPAPRGSCYVQIGVTFGNGSNPKHHGILDPDARSKSPGVDTEPRPYTFAPIGDRSARAMILHALGQARRFVYIEDQYLVNEEVAHALAGCLARGVQHVTMVMPHPAINGMPQQRARARRFLQIVGADPRHTDKARLYCIHPPERFGRLNHPDAIHGKVKQVELPDGRKVWEVQDSHSARPMSPHTYVHSKVFIIDDELAIIGSANCNVRSYTHDSEVIAAICDQPGQKQFGYTFAHRLRMALWAEHLFGIHGEDYLFRSTGEHRRDQALAELADGVASAVHWLDPMPMGSRVERLTVEDLEEPGDVTRAQAPPRSPYGAILKIIGAKVYNSDWFWKTVVDPDGS